MEIIATAYGGPEVLHYQKRPEGTVEDIVLGEDEVLVRNSYAGVNFIDTYFRSGLYRKPAVPFVPGEEGCGVVVRAGGTSNNNNNNNNNNTSESIVGRRVAYFGSTVSGSYATYSVVKRSAVRDVPDGVTDKDAAAVMCQGLTAHYLVHDSYSCRGGSVVVVHAAAGGTGLLICQLAKLRGATVIGICGGEVKAAMASSVGRADHVIDYAATPDWPAAVKAIAPDGVDAVYDGVGQATFAMSLSVLRPCGYMISFGNASGAVPPIAPLDLMRAGSVYLQRPTLGDYMRSPDEAARRVSDVFKFIQDGSLTVTIGSILPLKDAARAHVDLQERRTTGKTLLDCHLEENE